jgi:hypothetical protein
LPQEIFHTNNQKRYGKIIKRKTLPYQGAAHHG